MHPKPVPLTPRVGRLQSHRFSSTTERTMQADLCCSRAPQAVLQGAPLDCSSGTHCSAAWSMASAGCLQPLSDRQDRPGKATGQRTPKTNSNKTDEFRYNAAPGRGQKQRWRSKDSGPLGRQETPGLSHLSERCFFLCHSNKFKVDIHYITSYITYKRYNQTIKRKHLNIYIFIFTKAFK